MRNLAARAAMFAGSGGSRYQEIVAVKSDGTAYCVFPGIHNSQYGRLYIKFYLTSTTFEDEGWHYFGAHGSAAGQYFVVHCSNSNIRATGYVFGKYGNATITSATTGVDYTIDIGHDTSSWTYKINGSSKNLYQLATSAVLNTHILLFAANANGVTGDVVSPHFSPFPYLAIKEATYWNGVDATYNFKPVLDTQTNEYGFYDADNDVFMGNYASSGALVGITT